VSSPSHRHAWRAGCAGTRTSGSEGGPAKRTLRKERTARRSDPYSFAWKSRFRRLVRDYERRLSTLAGLHLVAFACLELQRVGPVLWLW
jgi:hypothetical protein